ncbi:hypothetical protein Sm713_51760 [Streptomyces sp. TS71-3]|nr:hypothetical protein Sm713_51760 [Streptomyces sp. TS71-3]
MAVTTIPVYKQRDRKAVAAVHTPADSSLPYEWFPPYTQAVNPADMSRIEERWSHTACGLAKDQANAVRCLSSLTAPDRHCTQSTWSTLVHCVHERGDGVPVVCAR